MSERLPFEIIFDVAVHGHFAAIDRKDPSLILNIVERQLAHQPNHATRNRKALRIPNSLDSTWELRCGMDNRYRVFYDIDVDNRLVIVLAVGKKIGSRIVIGSEEIEL